MRAVCIAFLAISILVALLLAVLSTSQDAGRNHVAGRMRVFVMSIDSYSKNRDGFMPQNVQSQDGVDLVSWRYRLAPLLDAAKLEYQIWPDVPWTAPEYTEEQYRVHIPMDLYIKLGQRKKNLGNPKAAQGIPSEEVMNEIFR